MTYEISRTATLTIASRGTTLADLQDFVSAISHEAGGDAKVSINYVSGYQMDPSYTEIKVSW